MPRRCNTCGFLMISLSGQLAIAQYRAKTDASGDASESTASEATRISRANTAILRFEDLETGTEIERVEDPVFRYTEQVRGRRRERCGSGDAKDGRPQSWK